MTDDMETHAAETDETAGTAPEAAAPTATPAAASVLMVRDPEKVPGMGMCKALVPAGEVEHYNGPSRRSRTMGKKGKPKPKPC